MKVKTTVNKELHLPAQHAYEDGSETLQEFADVIRLGLRAKGYAVPDDAKVTISSNSVTVKWTSDP